MSEPEVVQANTSQEYNDRYEAAYAKAVADFAAGKQPEFTWEVHGEHYCNHQPDAEGYIDGWNTAQHAHEEGS